MDKGFLYNQKMCVVVNHHRSNTRNVESGVPQGYVLVGWALLYINYLTHNIQSPTKIFADDLKLYVNVRIDTESKC